MTHINLDELLAGEITGCSCGRNHRLTTREVALQSGAMQRLPEMADRYFPTGMVLCVESFTGSDQGGEGVKLEQMVLVTDSGTEPLSNYPFEDNLLS